jgi:hypothetical protein
MTSPNDLQQTPESQGVIEEQIQAIRKTISHQWSEIISAVLLSAVAIGTAWSGFQSAQWGGIQSILFGQASARRVESTRASTLAGQQVTVDVMLFQGWVDAYASENGRLLAFYEERFRDEFKPAFEAWTVAYSTNASDAPSTPFQMDEYKIGSMQEAKDFEDEAVAKFAEGERANKTSDDYAFSTVLLATVLFFAGIATRFEWQPIRWTLIAIGSILLVFAVYNLLSLPIA